MSYKHIAISEEYYSHIETIKKNLDIKSNGELIESMILYFHVLGFDPRDLKQNSVIQEIGRIKNDISKLRDTTVAFIRQQEKGLLAPLINQVNTNTEQLLKYLANEPLTVKHLEEFKQALSFSAGYSGKQQIDTPPIAESAIEPADQAKEFEKQIIYVKEKAELIISHAKDLFRQFLDTGRKSIGKGFCFEEKVINMYKAEFERIKYK